MSDNDKQVIFILDDDVGVTQTLEAYILEKIPSVDVYTFNVCQDMFDHKSLSDCSLFIIDIELDTSLKGNEVAEELFQNKFNKPYLFISGKEYDFQCFSKYTYTYDFIKKPFDLNKLLNRIAVLLKVSRNYHQHELSEERLRFSIKELFDHTNIYMVILDDNMIVKTCSYKLAKDLEFENAEEILDLSWTQFLKEKDLDNIKNVHKNILDDSEVYQKSLREVTGKLLTKTGRTISVKWFNSRIKNGHTMTFSIGIPYNRKVTSADEIDSIRAYWKHVLDKDETTLRALKSLA